jgi:glycosyltransferase involved in cell wall biosynthesis
LLKILHVIPTLEGGGAERQLSILAKEQINNFHEVYILLRRGGVYEHELVSSGIVMYFMSDESPISINNFKRIKEVINTLKPDIIHTWLPQMDIAIGIQFLFGRSSSSKWVIAERTSSDAYKKNKFQNFIRRCLALMADSIIANSSHGLKNWSYKFTNTLFLNVIPNAIDKNLICQSNQVDPKIKFYSKPYFLVVGRLSEEKAIKNIIKSFSLSGLSDSVKLVIVGSGPMYDQLNKLVAELDCISSVDFYPYQKDWWALLHSCFALISSSRYEGEPNVILEAMAASCPLIVSDIDAHRAILDGDEALFFHAENINLLAHYMNEVVHNRNDAKARALLSSKKMNLRSPAKICNQYLTIYRRILQK